jgi:hypothetical protein
MRVAVKNKVGKMRTASFMWLQDRSQWRVTFNTILSFLIPKKTEIWEKD